MIMLGTLTLMMSIISIVIKLLLYIIENNAKKELPHKVLANIEVVLFNLQKIQDKPFIGCSFFIFIMIKFYKQFNKILSI